MSLLTWTVSDSGGHYADLGRRRYSVARTHGRVPRFVARWHRSRGQFTEGKNITGAPTIEAASLPAGGTRGSGPAFLRARPNSDRPGTAGEVAALPGGGSGPPSQ